MKETVHLELTYKELRKLIKHKPDDEEVIIISVGEYTKYYTLKKFLVDGKLSLL